MSNVLIGIIGVILFIGLALAGALFLGPRFQQSTNNSKAAAVVQAMQQTTSAANMYQLREGKTMLASDVYTNMETLASSGDLKTVLRVPMNNARIYTADKAGGSAAERADHVYAIIGTDDVARDVCIAIERQAGASAPDMTAVTDWEARVRNNRRVGCFFRAGQYYTYAPI